MITEQSFIIVLILNIVSKSLILKLCVNYVKRSK